MEYRPERTVRETVVVKLKFLAAKLDGDVGDAITDVNIWLGPLAVAKLTVPAEPDATGASQSGQHTNREAAGGGIAPRQ